ncbi:hypothetical protein DFJ58DRAFT_845684 [Suillus subalutaceus]|uniref:uncharacterized protein n=1 Tax=Suillus subalutaceus TaxID=48586 RepID=UPI001B8846D9|nr:uncharacterized protein DFJ58DRAFT_845684 [Suillus subalutaceus]KAG1839435.1 hypothetical protein DFJ58DRAFT_845684 [Suillus subalutaceus]
MDASDDCDPKLVIALPSEIFWHLIKFSRLSSVKFIGIGNYNLDDRFINDVTVAWLKIWALKFAPMRCASYTITFTAMISLSSRCRSLHTLHLTLDATQSTTIPQAPDGMEDLWPMQTALRKLHLGHSEVLKVVGIPYFLAEVFPTLSDFKSYYCYCNPNIDRIQSGLLEAWGQLRLLQKGEELEEEEEEERVKEDSDDDA